jgi:integrase
MESTRTADKELASEILDRIKEDLVREKKGLKSAERIVPILLSEFTVVYQEERKKVGKAPRTISTDIYALRRLLEFTGDCSLSSISDQVALRYRNYKLDTVNPSTTSIELRSIRAAFNLAVQKPDAKYLRINPFSQKGLVPVVDERRMPTFLMPTEKAAFLAAIGREDHRRFFQFLLLTGCRRGEAINLTWMDIDLEYKRVTFRKTKTRRDRSVPITLELMQIIMTLDRSQPKPFNWKSAWATKLFKQYLAKAGIKRDLHLHCLRHTAASDLVRAGVHLTKIQKFLGHSSVKVTEIYTHVLPEDLREVAETLSCTG